MKRGQTGGIDSDPGRNTTAILIFGAVLILVLVLAVRHGWKIIVGSG